ncbi:MAG: hypothetical protein AB7N24_23735 [Dehalococcoidia bacterium]
MSAQGTNQELERQLAGLLANRFGDGTLYLARAGHRGLLDIAIRRGLVSEEGFVTRKGRALLARSGH